MSIVIGVVLSLIIIACLVATALQVHCSRIENRQNKDKLRDEANVYSSNDSVSSGEKNRDSFFADKIFLNQSNVLLTEGEEKDPDIIPQPINGNLLVSLPQEGTRCPPRVLSKNVRKMESARRVLPRGCSTKR